MIRPIIKPIIPDINTVIFSISYLLTIKLNFLSDEAIRSSTYA